MSRQQRRSKILLIGDSCYDTYYFGSVNRLSPEAPIPVLDLEETVEKRGMASNVYDNLLALGVTVDMITCIVDHKKRYIDKRSGHQLLRVDERLPFNKVEVSRDFSLYDAIMISDYDKGLLTYQDIELIISQAGNVPVFIDTKKKDLARFEGAVLKLNNIEWESRTSDHSDCIVTRGKDDITYKGNTYKTPKVNAHDVCGAGDTFFAAYVYSSDINFALKAASITVQHIGVYSPSLKEIQQ